MADQHADARDQPPEKFRAIVEACGIPYHLTGGVIGHTLGEQEGIA